MWTTYQQMNPLFRFLSRIVHRLSEVPGDLEGCRCQRFSGPNGLLSYYCPRCMEIARQAVTEATEGQLEIFL